MNKIVLLVTKCALILLPVICVSVYAKYNLIAFGDQEYPNYVWNREFCTDKHDKTYDVVILGDSTANAAYMPEILSGSTINISLGGATPVENYYILKEWLENNNPPKTVYLSFMDNHFNYDYCFWTRTMYTHRFPAEVNWEIINNAKKFDERSIINGDYMISMLEYETYLPTRYITSMIRGKFFFRLKSNYTTIKNCYIFGGRYIAIGNHEWDTPKESEPGSFYVKPLFDYYFQELIRLCEANGSKVRIIRLPLPKTTRYNNDYWTEYNKYFNSLECEYNNVCYYLFSDYEINDFADSQHMNSHGALRFSTEIKSLFPEDFTADFTDDQSEAIEFGIRNENSLDHLFLWVKDKPYSIKMYTNGTEIIVNNNDDIMNNRTGEVVKIQCVDSKTGEIICTKELQVDLGVLINHNS